MNCFVVILFLFACSFLRGTVLSDGIIANNEDCKMVESAISDNETEEEEEEVDSTDHEQEDEEEEDCTYLFIPLFSYIQRYESVFEFYIKVKEALQNKYFVKADKLIDLEKWSVSGKILKSVNLKSERTKTLQQISMLSEAIDKQKDIVTQLEHEMENTKNQLILLEQIGIHQHYLQTIERRLVLACHSINAIDVELNEHENCSRYFDKLLALQKDISQIQKSQ